MARAVDARAARPAHAGLTDAEAAERFERFGPNAIPAGRRPSWFHRLARHVIEPMSLLLVVAAAVEGLALEEWLEAGAIMAIVALNAVVGTVQEGRAQRALDALRSMEPRFATVLRGGGRTRISLDRVVPGDVAVLTAGDRIPADADILEANALQVDESILTGESLPVDKDVIGDDADRHVSSGTLVTAGDGLAIVSATGASSSFGRIAAELGEERAPTPLQRRLRRLSRSLGIVAVLIAAGVFVLTIVRLGMGQDQLRDAFLSSVALAVAAVPEGLPAIVTVVLALGVRRMAERGAIIRRLPAVETLGSSTTILTDKTGTLTQNRMEVDRIATVDGRLDRPAGAVPPHIARAIALGCDATLEPPTGDPLEVALLDAVGEQRVRQLRTDHPRLDSLPFDAATRRTITISASDGGSVAVMKGAPEVVLDRCVDAFGPDGPAPLDREAVAAAVEEMTTSGSRVIAFASQERGAREDGPPPEDRYSFLGLAGLHDPIRKEASSAVADAAAAGIRVVMVTGDHAGTAASVARQVGLLQAEERVAEGSELHRMPSDDLSAVSVFARVAPDDKLDIVRTLQERDEIVAVTGDGVNDAPALRQADIGVAMGRTGSDVAREAADMVITDDDLGTIVHAVEEGRRLFGNIRRVIDYLVGGNLSEVAVVIGTLLLLPTSSVVLTPLQLLWVNLLTDGLPAVALGTGPSSDPTARAIGSTNLLSLERVRVLALRGAAIAVASLGSLLFARAALDASWEESRTVVFTVLVLSHLLYAFVVQLDRPGRRPRPLSALGAAPGLLLAVGAGVVLQISVVTFPPARDVFDTTALGPSAWLTCLAGASLAPTLMWLATRVRGKPTPHSDAR